MRISFPSPRIVPDRSSPPRVALPPRSLDRSGRSEGRRCLRGEGGNLYRGSSTKPRPAVEYTWECSKASATGKIKMKSKISIWDCRRAIEIAVASP